MLKTENLPKNSKDKKPIILRSLSFCTKRVEKASTQKIISSVHERLYQSVKKCAYCIQLESKNGILNKISTSLKTCTCKNNKKRSQSLDMKQSSSLIGQKIAAKTSVSTNNLIEKQSISLIQFSDISKLKIKYKQLKTPKLAFIAPTVNNTNNKNSLGKKQIVIKSNNNASNSVKKLLDNKISNVDLKSDSRASFKATLAKVPEMEETSTQILSQNINTINTSLNKQSQLSSRTNRSDFTLPPIGENASLFDKVLKHQQQQQLQNTTLKHYTPKRKDSGIADLDQASNGSEHEYYNSAAIVHHHHQQKQQIQQENNNSTLKKNATSSTLNSYGQSSQQSKPTTSSGYASLKTNNKKINRQSTQVTFEAQTNAPQPPLPPPFTRADSTLQRKNSPRREFTRLDSTRNYRPVPKPRQTNPHQIRSHSLQRQTTFVNESTNKRDMTISLKNNQTNLISMNKLAKSTNNLATPRPSTTNHASQRTHLTPDFIKLPNTTNSILKDNTNSNQLLNPLNIAKLEELNSKTRDELSQRVKRWLDDIIYDENSLSAPSIESKLSTHSDAQKLDSDAFDQLSDFGSYDEQIIEFNRVLDKTFCFVHND